MPQLPEYLCALDRIDTNGENNQDCRSTARTLTLGTRHTLLSRKKTVKGAFHAPNNAPLAARLQKSNDNLGRDENDNASQAAKQQEP